MKSIDRSGKVGVLLVISCILMLCTACGSDSVSASKINNDASKADPANIVPITLSPTTTPVIAPSATPAKPQAENGLTLGAPSTPDSTTTPALTLPPTIPPTVPPTATPTVAPTPDLPPALKPIPMDPAYKEVQGNLFDGSFFSKILNKTVPYRIYLPPGYLTSTQHYPVLYMLHGASGSYQEWSSYKLPEDADKLIVAHTVKPMIIVLPSGDVGFWVDQANGGPQYGQYMAKEVVPFIDSNYRTLPGPQNRAIGGLSMGAHGALQLGFNYPDIWGVIGSHSPTLRTYDQAQPFFGDQNWYNAHDPVPLAQNLPLETLKSLKIWIDIGKDDSWLPRTQILSDILTQRGVPHQFHIFDGGHGGEYWTTNAPQYLQFYADSMLGTAH
ncbi:MAG TPA: alpha/beta hydrolase-fold protein [Chloroflexia bacterium]|nr:alpha/beta hydrolase-fold protein [Chloroflexia bacterium]